MAQKPDPKEVGIRVRAVLLKLGVSMEEAANELGESRQNLSNVLNGYQLPSHGVAYELEKILPGVTVQWVFFGDDRMVPAKMARELAVFVELVREKAASPGQVVLKTTLRLASSESRPALKKLARASG